MDIQKSLDEMQELQSNLLNFIEDENDDEGNFRNLTKYFNDIKIETDIRKFKLFLHLLLKISNNHYRNSGFFDKIIQVLRFFIEQIKKIFTSHQIFEFFKRNKRILLFFIEEKMITVDKYFFNQITTQKFKDEKYIEYFFPEIENFIELELTFFYKKYEEDKMPEIFNEKRKIGESDHVIYKMIQNDSIDDFIVYVTRTNLSLNSKIVTSIFETNSFLLKNKKSSLIEYAAFFGALQIFQYLRINQVEINPSLWLYAIHGKNAEIIHMLEEIQLEPDGQGYLDCFKEAIKCHHNDIAVYFENCYNQKRDENFFSFKYYNFAFFDEESINQDSLYPLCQYNYSELVDLLLKIKKIDVNKLFVLKKKNSNVISKEFVVILFQII